MVECYDVVWETVRAKSLPLCRMHVSSVNQTLERLQSPCAVWLQQG